MGFRDDTEALRARAESLEQELSETRAELEEAKGALDERVSERRAARVSSLFSGMSSWLVRRRAVLSMILAAAIVVGVGYGAHALLTSSSPEGPPLPAILFSDEGQVTAVRGAAGVALGDACDVRIEPSDGAHNCRVHVTCATEELYSGWTHCRIVGVEAVGADDTEYGSDGDAKLHFDREAGILELEDAHWAVTLSMGLGEPSHTGTVTWRGVVERTVGSDVPPGSECTISAQVASDGYRPTVDELAVRCGQTTLYRATRDAQGAQWTRPPTLIEGPSAAPGNYQYVLRHDDHGGEATRARASIDTLQQRARVWRDVDPVVFVELRVDDASAVRRGAPFVDANQGKRAALSVTVDAPARVSAADPGAPVAPGDDCRFRLRSTWSTPEHNCRLSVACGDHFLFGGGPRGFAWCTITDGAAVAATSGLDEPIGLRYQRDTGTVSLRSFDAHRPWRVELQLSVGDPLTE